MQIADNGRNAIIILLTKSKTVYIKYRMRLSQKKNQ